MKEKENKIQAFEAETATAALNEQGFLLQQRIRQSIREAQDNDNHEYNHPWRVHASEYPVTAADGRQTRIDLVLTQGAQTGTHLCVECKRANRDYKAWIFFDQTATMRHYGNDDGYFETFRISRWPIQDDRDLEHQLVSMRLTVPCFNYYLEAKMERGGKISSTETIEDAFSQVMAGHTGLFAKLSNFQQQQGAGRFSVIPVVVTTARLFEAEFNTKNISLAEGMILSEHLQVKPLEYLAVNYHASDSLARKSDFGGFKRTSIVNDLIYWQMRTVFVVQAESINKFLNMIWQQVELGRWNL